MIPLRVQDARQRHPSAGRWAIDPKTSFARFTMKYAIFATLKGSLGAIEGTMVIDEDVPERSTVTASIDVSTVSTGLGLRDRHLRSADFFDVARFPTIGFSSTRLERIHDGAFRVVGSLTIRGITREVALDTAYEGQSASVDGARRAAFTATTVLSRRAFRLGSRRIEQSGIASDLVKVTLHIRAQAVA